MGESPTVTTWLSDAEWQNQVVSWIDNSVVILAMASVSRWVEWELKQVTGPRPISANLFCKISALEIQLTSLARSRGEPRRSRAKLRVG
jgi:hypothetical protein